jgi:signal transduction histidine kinase
VTFNIKDHITTIVEEFKNDLTIEQPILYKHSGKELVVLDPLLLKHIITNLLSNAIKFSTTKTVVEIKTKWINGQLILSVKDHGIGIPPEYREHLFEQFYRASNAINIQGTGLGLHLVNKYVTLMNGTVHYKSELEKGTQFVISFRQNKD